MRKQKKLTPTWEEIQEQVAYFMKESPISFDELQRINDAQETYALMERVQALWATRKGN
jgi:hypothetical protein